jgi:hypothetical protein
VHRATRRFPRVVVSATILGAVVLVVVGRLVALVLELGDVVGALVVIRHV